MKANEDHKKLSIGFFDNFSIVADEDSENGRIEVAVYDKRTGNHLVTACAVADEDHIERDDSWIDDYFANRS